MLAGAGQRRCVYPTNSTLSHGRLGPALVSRRSSGGGRSVVGRGQRGDGGSSGDRGSKGLEGSPKLVPLSGVEDGRYADVDLESLRKALVSSQSYDEDEDTGPDYSCVQGRNLALELVRVTEAAALEAGRWFGRGSEEKADRAAVKGMRKVLNAMEIDGVVVIGQGILDDDEEGGDFRLALLCGERVGCGYGHEVDIAVKALDGTTLVSDGHQGSISVISTAKRGALLDTGPCNYMVSPSTSLGIPHDADPLAR